MTAINRRTFLASAAAFAATPALGQGRSSGDVDVAIIGAGAAGLAAARRVAAAGRRYVLIEAGNRIGGRCVTDARSFGAPFDLGAHWIRQADNNPVVKAAGKAGLDVYPVPPGQKIRIGVRNAREGELEAFLTGQVRAIRAIAETVRGKGDIDAARALPTDPSSSRWDPSASPRTSPMSRPWTSRGSTATPKPCAARVTARCSRAQRRAYRRSCRRP